MSSEVDNILYFGIETLDFLWCQLPLEMLHKTRNVHCDNEHGLCHNNKNEHNGICINQCLSLRQKIRSVIKN